MKKLMMILMAVLLTGTVVSFKSENLSTQKEYSLVLHGMKGTLAQIYPQLDSAGCQKLAGAHLDSLLKLGGNSAEEQGLCCRKPFLIDMAEHGDLKNPQLYEELIDMANINMMMNAIMSDYEIWARAYLSDNMDGMLVDMDTILYHLQHADRTALNASAQNEFQDFTEKLISIMRNPEEATVENNPDLLCSMVLDKLSSPIYQYFYKEEADTVNFIDYTETKDTMLMLCGKQFYEIASSEGDRLALWLGALEKTSSFDERCSLVLQGAKHKYNLNLYSLLALEQLMDSEEYSLLLPDVWLTWRCLFQYYNLGMSRDAVMANHVYEYYKNKVINTMARYMAGGNYTQNDMTALCILILKSHLIRNGSAIMGNDCWLEMMEHVPNFNN